MWDFSAQPLVIYPLLAAGLLVLVALLTSWLYGDLLALFRVRGMFFVSAAVASAFFIYLVSVGSGSGLERATFGQGLSRSPLYLLALAYGPGVGLLGGSLFVMLSYSLVAGHSLGSFEFLLLLELVVLGWLATSPSIFKVRWAAAFNIPLACLLAWATAGTALLQSGGYDARLLSVHWNYHQHALWAIYICTAALSLLSPAQCRNFFRGSSLIQAAKTIQTQTLNVSSIYAKAVQLEGLEAKPIKTNPARKPVTPPVQPVSLATQPQVKPLSSAAQARRRLLPIAVRLSKHDTMRERTRTSIPEIELHSKRRARERSLEPVQVKDLV